MLSTVQVLVVDTLDLAAAAMKHIVTCSSITVCCGGLGGSTSGPTTVIQVCVTQLIRSSCCAYQNYITVIKACLSSSHALP